MAKPLRFGMAGCGSVSQRGLLPHLAQEDVQDRVVLAAVMDLVSERARLSAERYGAEQWFGDYDQMLAKGDLDAVGIASPIGIHYEQIMKALNAGKHVYVNKAMTTTRAEADQVIELARQQGLHVVPSPGEVLRPEWHYIRRFIEDDGLGELVWAATGGAFGTYHESEETRKGDDARTNIDPSWYYQERGGGPLYDMTIYGLHALTAILGPAKQVTAMSGLRVKEREFRGRKIECKTDDNTFMIVDFGEALLAFVFGAGAGNPLAGHRPCFFGTKGSILDTKLNGQPIDYPERELAEKEGRNAPLPHVVGPHRKIGESHVFEDIMQLVDLVNDGKPTPVTPEHARHVIEVFDAAYRAAETGQAQVLETTFDWQKL